MKRIAFLDYVRVFACFLVILVHASENFYGAPGSTDMAGPQSFLANEADRLWVSIFKGPWAMSTGLAIPCISITTFICSYLSCKVISYLPGSKWMIGA